MSHIKEYETVHRDKPELTFRIFRTEELWRKNGGRADAPHRHSFYTVLLVLDGEGTHSIDYNVYAIAPKQLFFVSPGQVHQVTEARMSTGYVLLFSEEFMADSGIDSCFLDDLRLFRDYGDAPPIALTGEQMEALRRLCEQMVQLGETAMKFRDQAQGALLKLFLIEAVNISQSEGDETGAAWSGGGLVRRFRKLVEEKYTMWHQTAPYAKALGVSADHLSRTLKQLVGKTAKAYIQTRLTVESKRLLSFSDLSTKEISARLGFSDPANFSAFFSAQTGTAPSRFRERQLVGKS